MFFWKPGNACGGGERKGKVMKTLGFYLCIRQRRRPGTRGAGTPGKYVGPVFITGKSLRHARDIPFLFSPRRLTG